MSLPLQAAPALQQASSACLRNYNNLPGGRLWEGERSSIDPELMIRMLIFRYDISCEQRLCAEIELHLAYAGSSARPQTIEFLILDILHRRVTFMSDGR
jgi:hypothetical protein